MDRMKPLGPIPPLAQTSGGRRHVWPRQCVRPITGPLHPMLQKLCNHAFRTSSLVLVHMNYSPIIQIIKGPKWPGGTSPSSQTSVLTLSLSLLVTQLSSWLGMTLHWEKPPHDPPPFPPQHLLIHLLSHPCLEISWNFDSALAPRSKAFAVTEASPTSIFK